MPRQSWPRLRRSDDNIAIGPASIDDNEGIVTLVYDFDNPPADDAVQVPDLTPGDAVPILGRERRIYLSTEEGLLSITEEGTPHWFFDRCGEMRCSGSSEVLCARDLDCPNDEICETAEGPAMRGLSTPTISVNGRDIIVGSVDPDDPNGGNIFRLREPENGTDPTTCEVAFPTASTSAALTAVDGGDLALLSFTTGTTSGRLTSIDSDGQRRWSFPAGEPFPGDLSSAPALSVSGFVITSPDGRVHSIDPNGRARWSANVGGPYDPDEPIPSPAVFGSIFTVSEEGDVVAFSSTGTRLWTFSPEGEDAKVVGTVAVSTLATEGGVFLGENVVFALDDTGMVYGIGTETGELVRFCQTDNRACKPSTCPNEGTCFERKACSDNPDVPCEGDRDCDDSEACIDQFFCSETETTTRCVRDLCIDSNDEATDGLCRREAKQRLSPRPADFVGSIALSSDSLVVASTRDGRVCVRSLDGSIPNGTCRDSGNSCTPDSCGPDGECCVGVECCPDTPEGEEPTCEALGRCTGDPSRPCTADTCIEDQDDDVCETIWDDGEAGIGGCLALGEDVGETILSAPVIDVDGSIVVTTEKGIARIE